MVGRGTCRGLMSKSNTHTHSNTHTEREQDMSKSKSAQQSNTAAEPAWPVPRGYFVTAWSVKGRGKSASYCAAMAAGTGEPGQRVALVAKSGAVTLATLTEVREQSDGVARWDFDRVKLTPEQQAANRAAKSASTASYWSSPAGLETAERIAQRAAKSEHSEPEPEQHTEPEPEPAKSEPAADFTAMAAAMRAAGFTASEVLAAMAEQSPSPSPSKPAKSKSPSKPRAASKPEPEPAGLALCDACNRERRNVKPHSGAPELETCPRCSTLDADTARVRAERHS